MTYFEGFLIPVPANKQQQFVAHARTIDPSFIDEGATRVVETWEADLKEGKTTDFYRAVDKTADEMVAFSWVEWPDKATRDAGHEKFAEMMKTDPRWDQGKNPMPFDGKRMVFGGFEGFVERGSYKGDSYVQGFVLAVPEARKEDYRQMAEDCWPIFEEYGATCHVEAWGEDVPHGKHTDFHRTVKAEEGENIVFSFIEWPSREVCDAAQQKLMDDDRMGPPEGKTMPFDGKRMIWGGFTPVYEVGA